MSGNIFISVSPGQTQNIARDLAHSLKSGTTIVLQGELGSGKTTFAQGFGAALALKRMLSPTYTLIRSYPLRTNNYQLKTLYHIDLYRLSSPSEALDLGLPELWSDPANILLIEWPEKINHLLPENHIQIKFETLSPSKRKITIT